MDNQKEVNMKFFLYVVLLLLPFSAFSMNTEPSENKKGPLDRVKKTEEKVKKGNDEQFPKKTDAKPVSPPAHKKPRCD
jgi:hypothetical protein